MKIQELAPLLSDNFTDFEPNEQLWEKNNQLIESNKSILGEYFKYQIQLHDSWIIKTENKNDSFIITLNEFSHFVFANALIDKKNLRLNKDKLIFPLKLKFKSAEYSLNDITEKGDIQQIEFKKPDVFLHEQILELEKNNLKIGWVVWNYGEKNKQGKEYLLLITATEFEIVESQDESWNNYFGIEYDKYLKKFKSELKKGTYLSDQWICEELIDKIDKDESFPAANTVHN
jgi:hypothetical protein